MEGRRFAGMVAVEYQFVGGHLMVTQSNGEHEIDYPYPNLNGYTAEVWNK